MDNPVYCPPFWIRHDSSSAEKIFLSFMVHIFVSYQAHFTAVTSGCSCKMPLFSLVCAGQTVLTAVQRDHSVSSVLDNSYLSARSHYNTLHSCSIKLDSHILTSILFACSVQSLHFLILCFLKPGDADGKVCQHEAPVELQPLPELSAGNAFAYGNGEGQNTRDTLATSANSLRDACSKTKLSLCWRETNKPLFSASLALFMCLPYRQENPSFLLLKEFLSTLLVRASSVYTVLGHTEAEHYREKSFPCRQLV